MTSSFSIRPTRHRTRNGSCHRWKAMLSSTGTAWWLSSTSIKPTWSIGSDIWLSGKRTGTETPVCLCTSASGLRPRHEDRRLSGHVRPDHQRARGPHQPGPAPVRQDLRGRGREPTKASGAGLGGAGGIGAPRHQGDSPRRSGAVPRSSGGLRPPAGGPRGDQGAPGRVGLRVRTADGAHESQPGPERGDRLPHAQPGIHLSDVDDHQGSGPTRGRPHRPGTSRDRPSVERTPAGRLPMKLAQRVGRTSPSPTLRITAEAKAMAARGVDVIDFASGEPDFDTPVPVKEAGIAAIRSGFTKYTAAGGIDELKLAVVEKLRRDQGLTYDTSQVLISCGAKHTLYNLAQALYESGDEVIIPSPYWVSFPEQVLLNDATPVLVPTEERRGFRLTGELLAQHVTPRTKAVVVNTPGNPTGSVYDRRTLEEIAKVALRHDLLIISDEIYEKLLYDGLTHVSIASLGPEVQGRTVVVNGVSKTYAMPNGAFYTFPHVGRLIGRRGPEGPLTSATALAAYLLQEARTVMVPGEAFGAPEHVRVSYATSMPKIVEGLNRIEEAIRRLK